MKQSSDDAGVPYHSTNLENRHIPDKKFRIVIAMNLNFTQERIF